MKSVRLEIPEDEYGLLEAHAKTEGMSVEDYLLLKARRRTVGEVFERARRRGGVELPGVDFAALVREDRDSR